MDPQEKRKREPNETEDTLLEEYGKQKDIQPSSNKSTQAEDVARNSRKYQCKKSGMEVDKNHEFN